MKIHSVLKIIFVIGNWESYYTVLYLLNAKQNLNRFVRMTTKTSNAVSVNYDFFSPEPETVSSLSYRTSIISYLLRVASILRKMCASHQSINQTISL